MSYTLYAYACIYVHMYVYMHIFILETGIAKHCLGAKIVVYACL